MLIWIVFYLILNYVVEFYCLLFVFYLYDLMVKDLYYIMLLFMGGVMFV